MTRIINLRKELEDTDVKRFERRESERLGRMVTLRDIPFKNFVDVSSSLLETKISQLFMKGAAEDAAFWPNFINVVQLDSPIQEVPVISERDFAVHKGRMPNTGNLQSGGKFTSARLDTTNDDNIRYMYIPIDEEDIKVRNFDIVERAIVAAGRKYAKNILNDITAHYDGISGKTQALSTDKRFVAIAKLIASMADSGYMANLIFFEVNDWVKAFTEETTGGTMPWLMQLQNGAPLGDNFGRGVMNGFVGLYMGRVPVYSIANEGGAGAGEIFAIDVEAAAVFGWAPGGQIQLKQEVNKMADLINNKITSKYAIASPSVNANAVGVVTGASA